MLRSSTRVSSTKSHDGFKVGDRVEWTSQSAGFERQKIGEVVEVVPAGQAPQTRLRFPGGPRDHESYVVRAEAQKCANRRSALYWPRVAQLRPAAKEPTP